MLSQRDRRMLLPAPSDRQIMVYAERLSGFDPGCRLHSVMR
jgi:hypothetical protein